MESEVRSVSVDHPSLTEPLLRFPRMTTFLAVLWLKLRKRHMYDLHLPLWSRSRGSKIACAD